MNDMIVREVANGQWFVLGCVMTVYFLAYAIIRPLSIGPYEPALIDRHLPIVTQFALALGIYMSGSSLRAAYIWVLLHCQNAGGDCSYIQNNAWVMLFASILANLGGLWSIRTLSPTHWRPYTWMGACAISLVVPSLYYSMGA